MRGPPAGVQHAHPGQTGGGGSECGRRLAAKCQTCAAAATGGRAEDQWKTEGVGRACAAALRDDSPAVWRALRPSWAETCVVGPPRARWSTGSGSQSAGQEKRPATRNGGGIVQRPHPNEKVSTVTRVVLVAQSVAAENEVRGPSLVHRSHPAGLPPSHCPSRPAVPRALVRRPRFGARAYRRSPRGPGYGLSAGCTQLPALAGPPRET